MSHNKQNVAQAISTAIQARENCLKSGNREWWAKWNNEIAHIVANVLPSGSGWDDGTSIDDAKTTADKIVLFGSWHHTDESGGYRGWTNHEIIITPAFTGVNIRVMGRDRNGIKDYLAEMFHQVMTMSYSWTFSNTESEV